MAYALAHHQLKFEEFNLMQSVTEQDKTLCNVSVCIEIQFNVYGFIIHRQLVGQVNLLTS